MLRVAILETEEVAKMTSQNSCRKGLYYRFARLFGWCFTFPQHPCARAPVNNFVNAACKRGIRAPEFVQCSAPSPVYSRESQTRVQLT